MNRSYILNSCVVVSKCGRTLQFQWRRILYRYTRRVNHSRVVQWLGYAALTREARVQFPAREAFSISRLWKRNLFHIFLNPACTPAQSNVKRSFSSDEGFFIACIIWKIQRRFLTFLMSFHHKTLEVTLFSSKKVPTFLSSGFV